MAIREQQEVRNALASFHFSETELNSRLSKLHSLFFMFFEIVIISVNNNVLADKAI